MGIFGKKEVVKEVGLPLKVNPTPEGPEKPKPVIEKIPEDTIKLIKDLGAKKNNLLNNFLHVSAQVVNLQSNQKILLEEIEKADRRIKQEIDFAGTKLKLNKRTEYRWQYDGQGNFVGTLKPKPKVQPEPPKK